MVCPETQDLKKLGHPHAEFIKNKEKIPEYIKKIIKSGDIVITMGAGDIWRQVDNIYTLLD